MELAEAPKAAELVVLNMSNKTKLETAARFMRECAADETLDLEVRSPWFPELMSSLAEWLEIESQRHINLGGLDSGYEQVNYWDAPTTDPETAELEPCIRVANLFIDNCITFADDEEPEREIIPAVTW